MLTTHTVTSTTWLCADEVCARLRCSWDTVRARMTTTTTTTAAVNIGSAKRPVWRFDAAVLDAWWREACRASTETLVAPNGVSVGATPTAARTPATSRRGRRPGSSSARSKTTTPSADRGNLVLLATSLASRS